jgi:hypothetical protein
LSHETVLPAQELRPVLVRLPDIPLFVFIPDRLHFFVKIEIKFVVNYCPGFRVDVCRGPTAYGIGSVTPVLRRIFFGVCLKQDQVFLAGETPLGAMPFLLKFCKSLNRASHGEIGHRIVALEGNPFSINIYGRCPC